MTGHIRSATAAAALAIALVSLACGRPRARHTRSEKGTWRGTDREDEGTVYRNVNANRNVNVNRGYAAPRGTVVRGEEGAAAVGRRGAVAVGEEGAAAVGRYGRVYATGEYYESYEGWRVAAGVASGIAVGTMLARPPSAATTVVVRSTNYYYSDGAFFAPVSHGGGVNYQVVAAPVGAMVTTLPTSCTTVVRANVAYRQCGPTYYQPVAGGFRVVASSGLGSRPPKPRAHSRARRLDS